MTTHDPILVHLFDRLPAEGQPFTTGDRERWIAAMDAALQFLYPPEWTQEARRRAKKAAAAHFPTIIAPPGGVTIAGPVSEPVLIVPVDAQKPSLADPHYLGPPTGGVFVPAEIDLPPEEAPSTTTFADAVDDAGSSVGDETTTGAGPAAATSSPGTPVVSPPESARTSPSSGDPAPARSRQPKGEPVRIVPPRIPPPQEGRKRHFTADQKGAILRRVVREGMPAVQADTLVHESTLNRWIREMPIAVQTFTEEWEAEQALAEGGPTVEELEAEKAKPVPPPAKPKPAVQWPSTPIERRPVDHERVRRGQADWA